MVTCGNLTDLPGVEELDGDRAPNEGTLSRLYAESPYAGFAVEPYPEDLQGWNSYANVFRDVIEAVRPRRIIEVGVWKGTASIHMAKIVRELDLRCEIICIDTWLGSPEHILAGHGSERYKSLALRNGYPQLFYTFLSNVIRQGVADYVVPLPMTSESAVVVLRRLGLRADIIHIDAAHQYEPVLRDFSEYWRLLSDRGVLIGDDYDFHRGVTRAADEFASTVGRPLCASFPKCVLAKSPQIQFSVAHE